MSSTNTQSRIRAGWNTQSTVGELPRAGRVWFRSTALRPRPDPPHDSLHLLDPSATTHSSSYTSHNIDTPRLLPATREIFIRGTHIPFSVHRPLPPPRLRSSPGAGGRHCTSGEMGRTFRIYLAGEYVYCCRECGNHLAVSESVISTVSRPPTSGTYRLNPRSNSTGNMGRQC